MNATCANTLHTTGDSLFGPHTTTPLPESTIAEHATNAGRTPGQLLDQWPSAAFPHPHIDDTVPPILAGLLITGVPETLVGTVDPQTGAITLADLPGGDEVEE